MNTSLRLRLFALVAVCLYVWIISAAAAADAVTGDAVSVDAVSVEQEFSARSSAGFENERPADERRDPASLQELVSADVRPAGTREAPAQTRKHGGPCCAFRIFDARTRLFDDFDADGYFTYLRVVFDIDTDYYDADVFVRLFLRGSDDRWAMIFESDVFPIFGNSGADDYEVETELVSGFPRDHYDLLIEVYEAPFGDLVVEYGSLENPALGFLPLEDISSDGALPPPVAISSGGGGGAVTYELLMLLFLVGWAGLRHRWVGRS